MENIEKLLTDKNVEAIFCTQKTQHEIFKNYGIIKKVYMSEELNKKDNIVIIKYNLWNL